MPRKKKDIIGEGTYGCVYKPALKCKSSTTRKVRKVGSKVGSKIGSKGKDKNLTSKVLKKSDAKVELKEYNFIDKIDKTYEYHVRHESCIPDESELSNIKKCDRFRDVKNMNNLKLIQMPYGGKSIDNILKELKEGHIADVNKFGDEYFKSFINLFEGIKLFNDNGFIHFDIKSGNILYDASEKRFLFIDFGLSIRKENMKGTNCGTQCIPWGYFPIDTLFYDIDNFNNIKSLNKDSFNESTQNSFTNGVIKIYFNENEESFYRGYLIKFFKTFLKFRKTNSYENYMEISTRTVDIYSLGLVLKESIDVFHSLGYFTDKKRLYRSLMNLIDEMITYDFTQRLSPEKALQKYIRMINSLFP